MGAQSPVPAARRFGAQELGWVRTPQHDEPGVWAWESPDGQLYAHDNADEPLIYIADISAMNKDN
jgi:hypothetical protein